MNGKNMKIAFLFPGQGAQYLGMAKSIYDNFSIARMTFDEASTLLGFNLSNICFHGSLSELNRMEVMFPAIVTACIAIYRVYEHNVGIKPTICAGHSLGEYSALVCAKVLRFSDAIRIVYKRGMIAQKYAENSSYCMTIIDGVEGKVVQEICKDIKKSGNKVEISCYNSQRQTVVCGSNDSIKQFESVIIGLNGNATPLINSAPLHTSIMKDESEELSREIGKYEISDFAFPVVSNVKGDLYKNKEEIAALLNEQIKKPVQWYETMRLLNKMNINIAIEMGPKRLLSGLIEGCTTEIKALCYGLEKDRKVLHEYLLN